MTEKGSASLVTRGKRRWEKRCKRVKGWKDNRVVFSHERGGGGILNSTDFDLRTLEKVDRGERERGSM